MKTKSTLFKLAGGVAFLFVVLLNLAFYFSNNPESQGITLSALAAHADPVEGTGENCPKGVPGCGGVTGSEGNFIIACAKHGGFLGLGACKVKHEYYCATRDWPDLPL